MRGVSLEVSASRLGLHAGEEARKALTIGARFLAHGFSATEIDLMIQKHYADEAAKHGITPDDIAALDILGMNQQ